MSLVDVEVLRWFREVGAGVTVTETAARVPITQPALSRALARLEDEVGAVLFQRSGRKIRLTAAGRTFHQHIETVLDQYDTARRALAEQVDPTSGVVPLAFLHTFGTWLVPPLLSGFRREHRHVRFELKQHGEEAILAALLDGLVDLVLTSGDPGHPEVEWHKLLTEPLHLAVPRGHRLARRRQVRLAEAASEPFIVLRPGYGLRATTEQLCRQAGFQPQVAFEGEEVETLRGLVTAGLGVSLLPLPQLPIATIHHVPVSDVDCFREIGLAWLRTAVLPPSSAEFRDYILAEYQRD
jgi:DNA-binding transcriptional LysR family regulator